MSIIISFKEYDLPPRFDGVAWSQLEIYEAATETGPFTSKIDTLEISPVAQDPAHPLPYSFTTSKGTIADAWYMVRFLDPSGGSVSMPPRQNAPANEIMATLDDVNAHLDGSVIEATADNTDLVQVSVARVIRGYLGRVLDTATLMSWSSPDVTPEIIREIASMLIAAQVYFNESARTSLIVDDNNFAQRLYDKAMAMLQLIIDGQIVIIPPEGAPPTNGTGVVSPEILTVEDFFPVDATDRAFTLGMQL